MKQYKLWDNFKKEENFWFNSFEARKMSSKVYDHSLFKKNAQQQPQYNLEFKLCGKQTCFDDDRIILTQNWQNTVFGFHRCEILRVT